MNGKRQAAARGKTGSAAGKNASVLVVVAEMGRNSQREIAGVSAWARENGWKVDVVEGSHFGDRPDFAKWIEFWRPGGIVVDPMYARAALADPAASALPLVVWDAASASGGALPEGCAKAMSDPDAVADAAARELLDTGMPRFAFVPAIGNPDWSRARADAFARTIHSFGHPVSVMAVAERDAGDPVRYRAAVSRFVSSLEKPCGVFAANDPAAEHVRNECAALGLRIPQDVALVGVDDSDVYCERGEPTLSSVRVAVEEGGRRAAALLASLVLARAASAGAKDKRRAGAVALYGVERVARRASSRVLAVFDARVARALEWIRLHACDRIEVPDVVAEMGCSRRLADLRFRKAAGRTILAEIHARRLEAAKALLARGDVPLSEIPARCGFAPGPRLGVLFKRATGLSMRDWRAERLRLRAR